MAESSTELTGGGAEAAIGRAAAALAAGDLVAAANALDGPDAAFCGTGAEAAAQEWAQAARERAVVEQGVELLQAYAATVTASLISDSVLH